MTDAAALGWDLARETSPPRHNGEIVFAAPWERRVFGVTLTLCRSGRCEWESFRQRLIRRIAEDETRPYWESWAAALEDAVTDAAQLAQAELECRHRALLARPAGHDHRVNERQERYSTVTDLAKLRGLSTS